MIAPGCSRCVNNVPDALRGEAKWVQDFDENGNDRFYLYFEAWLP